ncbi:monovalent cation/H(+) antiporter subunit G [Wenzhouxiangella sp. AB-CW3]|uniref:monovalent cation/H(+) antiporter subunit G n=1 Tax=Wenzhouxiangella sp. AB-CW3 TaxID=2771012 RepID=UPI00168BAE88|nr:monovalent cation/H(+) antiporter subunit G [Wenzhouxiangella sp. AB-CW3]QOC22153.1 monovalent cation/H(+) antiporter subunit G [Wenzhouxiangella sp. AB-CW3]
MAETAINILSWILMLTGGAAGVIGGIGLLRLPDFYTRLHAAGVTETLCALAILLGLALQTGLSLVTIKLVLILVFLLFTAPTATHALARAAMVDEVEPEVIDNETGPTTGEPSSNT